jgi:hypothetical protein
VALSLRTPCFRGRPRSPRPSKTQGMPPWFVCPDLPEKSSSPRGHWRLGLPLIYRKLVKAGGSGFTYQVSSGVGFTRDWWPGIARDRISRNPVLHESGSLRSVECRYAPPLSWHLGSLLNSSISGTGGRCQEAEQLFFPARGNSNPVGLPVPATRYSCLRSQKYLREQPAM